MVANTWSHSERTNTNYCSSGTRDEWGHVLSGVSLADMKITLFLEGKKQFHKRGGLLFTHFGLSGPLILNLSGAVWDMLQSGQVTAHIDVYPDKDIGTLDTEFVAHFELHKNKILKNTLKDIVPLGMIPGIMILCRILILIKKYTVSQKKNEECS